MIDEQLLNRINSKLDSILPPGVSAFRDEIETNLKIMLKESLGKLDLVTREEFDIQKAVLEKTQARVKHLEAVVKELEDSLK